MQTNAESAPRLHYRGRLRLISAEPLPALMQRDSYPKLPFLSIYGSCAVPQRQPSGCQREPGRMLSLTLNITQADKRSGLHQEMSDGRVGEQRKKKKRKRKKGGVKKGLYLPYVPEFIYFYELVHCYSGSQKGQEPIPACTERKAGKTPRTELLSITEHTQRLTNSITPEGILQCLN